MAPFIALAGSFLLFRALGMMGLTVFGDWVTDLRIAVACMFVLTASAHWGKRRPDLVRMVPGALPKAELIVSLTGWLELIGAAGIVIPGLAKPAAIGLTLLLLAMFPANVHAARKGVAIAGKPPTPIGLRTALQLIFIAAILLAGFPPVG